MEAWTFDSQDPEETRALGRALGQAIGVEGLAVALVGPLGAGKTVFVKGLAEGLGVDPRVVSSPTFVIAQQYVVPATEVGAAGRPETLHHVDLYRLESEDELETIGFYDMFAPGAVVAVEWADRFPDVLGRDFLQIELEGPKAEHEGELGAASNPKRGARVQAFGGRAKLILEDWAGRVERSRAPSGRPLHLVEMRLRSTLLLAIGLVLGTISGPFVEAAHDDRRACPELRVVESDQWGTRRAACVEGGGDPRGDGLAAPTGVAKLLAGQQIDLNQASEPLLETLPGIGPARARAIARARPFRSVAEIERVPGIGPKTRARLERWLTVAARSGAARATEAPDAKPSRAFARDVLNSEPSRAFARDVLHSEPTRDG